MKSKYRPGSMSTVEKDEPESGSEAQRGQPPHLQAQWQDGMGRERQPPPWGESRKSRPRRRARFQLKQEAMLREEVRPRGTEMMTDDLRGHSRRDFGGDEAWEKGQISFCPVLWNFKIFYRGASLYPLPSTVPSISWFVKIGNSYPSVLVIFYELFLSRPLLFSDLSCWNPITWRQDLLNWFFKFWVFSLLFSISLSFCSTSERFPQFYFSSFLLSFWFLDTFLFSECSFCGARPSCFMDAVFICPLKMVLTVSVSVHVFLCFVFSFIPLA